MGPKEPLGRTLWRPPDLKLVTSEREHDPNPTDETETETKHSPAVSNDGIKEEGVQTPHGPK